MTNRPTHCQHRDCDGDLQERSDPLLPPEIVLLECELCGEWYLLDTETGTVKIDN